MLLHQLPHVRMVHEGFLGDVLLFVALAVAALLGLGDWAQEHDEPLLFVPHHMHAADASLVRWSADALQISDIHAYQPDNDAWRLMSGALDLEPVFA